MSHLFADIFDGIRFLRILKGVPEKDILDYVQSRVGNMKVGNVLKTIRTLRKLVEEGILIKRGKRYSLSGKCPQPECYDSEYDTQGDDCDGEGEDDENKKDEENAQNEEEEEEDDDEEDDFDYDDDDDDDDDDMANSKGNESKNASGNNNNASKTSTCPEDSFKKDKRSSASVNKDGTTKLNSKDGFIMKPKVGDEDNRSIKSESIMRNAGGNGTEEPAPITPVPEVQKKKGNKRKRNFVERKGTKRKSRSQESAFCARDFIDYLEEGSRENFDAMDLPTEDPEYRGRSGKFVSKPQASRIKQEREPRSNYRSRSPVLKRKREPCDSTNKGRSDELGSSKVLFQDPVDEEAVVEENKAVEGPNGVLIPRGGSLLKIPDAQPPRPPSCTSSIQEVKREPSVEECTVVDILQNKWPLGADVRGKWMQMANKGHERTRRGASRHGRGHYYVRSESLCSVCDKRRRNS